MFFLRTAFLFCAVTLALPLVAAQSTAKDEAIRRSDAAVIVLKHARIIDGTGAAAKENQTLVIEAARIRAVGNDGDIDAPDAAPTLDMAGRTVLPGLVMLHEHLMFTEPIGLTRPQDFSFPRLYLAFGVTTMRTAGTDYPYIDLNLKRRLDAGLLPGPEIYITSPYFSGEGDPFLGAMILKTPRGGQAKRSLLGCGGLYLVQGISVDPEGSTGCADRRSAPTRCARHGAFAFGELSRRRRDGHR